MDIQTLVNTIGEVGRMERSNYHLTLGEAIEKLNGVEGEIPVTFDFHDGLYPDPDSLHSYRGYYSDLAVEATGEPQNVADIRKALFGALGEIFEGWKGGDFVMNENTPLWIAYEGTTSDSRAITGIQKDSDKVTLITKQIE